MADTYKRRRVSERTGLSEGGGVQWYEYVYEVGKEIELADVDLEEGDYLPDVSTAQILESNMQKRSKSQDANARFIQARGRVLRPWVD